MLAELESNPLCVILAPSRRIDRREWDYIRVPLTTPPPWYRKICARYPSSREVRRGKFDTRIRRQNILRVLQRLAEGKPTKSKYAADLLAVAQKLEANPF